jgi:hypothetical protein
MHKYFYLLGIQGVIVELCSKLCDVLRAETKKASYST